MADIVTVHTAEPASGGPARHLVVLLHGVGVDGTDLMALAPLLAMQLPDAAFVAPDAPEPYDMAPFGRQWFSLADRSGAALAAGIRRTAPALDAFLDHQLAERGLDDTALALVGFSQGTMMALHVAFRRGMACAGVVGFSGAVIDPDSLAAEKVCRPRVLLVHGDSDEVVNPDCLPASQQALTAHGIPVLAEIRPGLGHGIDGPGLSLAAGFLRQCLGIEETDG